MSEANRPGGGERGAPGEYDEFGLFHENAEEFGLPFDGPPAVERVSTTLPSGLSLSALRWGTGDPQVVLVHGGAQNAHTWDTVALALDVPLLAVDLPGHGHSDWRPRHDYWPGLLADDVAVAVAMHAPGAKVVCGMSLGGLTSICLAAARPDLVRRLVVVDVTPGTDHAKAEPIVAFISGPEVFESFDAILERTVQYNPTRSVSSLRRGVLHNARPQPDGTWVWRYDNARAWRMGAGDTTEDVGRDQAPDFGSLWDEVDAVPSPLLLVRGGASTVVGDEDVEELVRRKPDARVVVVEGAGHSVQGDKPLELADLLRAELTV